MAKTTRVVLVCDLHGDGTEAVTTIRMDNGTARYELDLCQSHLDEQVGGSDRGVEPVEPAQPRKPPVRRPRRRLGAAAAVPRTRRPCASGPAPMAIRSAVEVESRGTSWKPSPPANRRLQAQDRQDPGPDPRGANRRDARAGLDHYVAPAAATGSSTTRPAAETRSSGMRVTSS